MHPENENTDTTVTPLADECADCPEVVTADASDTTPARKINPIVYIGLGIALVAMGQEFIEDGLRAAQSGGLAGGRRTRTFAVPVAHARIDR